jgi:hypothetical protein
VTPPSGLPQRQVRLLLVHEMPDVDVEPGRHAVEFASFFAGGATPRELIDAGIYKPIATSLNGGVWRQTSLVMMAQALRAAMPFGGVRTGSMKHLTKKVMSRRGSVPRTGSAGSPRPVVLLTMREAQRQHELALEQPELESHEHEVAGSRSPGTPIGGRRRQPPGALWSAQLASGRESISSRSSRRYEPMDDDIELSQARGL